MMQRGHGYILIVMVIQLTLARAGISQPVDSFLNLDVIVGVEVAESLQSKNLETSPVFYENGLVFVYAREKSKFIDPKIGMPYFELMYCDLGPDGQPRRPVSFSSNIRSRFHEGPASFSNDFNQIFFTRSNTRNGQGVADDDKKIRLKIFSATKGPEDWEGIAELPFCDDGFSTCHPAVSTDGTRIIFSSDRPGGYGGMDLYFVDKENGTWQEPVNLGPGINTRKNEIFPTLMPNGVLFFSSNGHDGFGGLDIFATHIGTKKVPAGLIRMPAPFNSRADDLGLVVDHTGTEGYLASARGGRKFRDDIYLVKTSASIFRFPDSKKLTEPVLAGDEPEIIPADTMDETDSPPVPCDPFKFRIRTRSAFMPVANATINLEQEGTGNEFTGLSDRDGVIEVCLPSGSQMNGRIQADGFEDHVFEFMTEPGLPGTWNILLRQVQTNALEVDRIETGVTIVLDNIYYDFNKSAIQRGAALELEELSSVMRTYPSMRILLTAHTDSRGTGAYNLELSERRALAAKDFLVARGISGSRIETVAMGESEIRNHCVDGVSCTEAEHRYNRRTEVKVLHIDAPVQFRYKESEQE